MVTKIEISVKTLVIIAVFFLVLGIIYLTKDVLILLFISFILKSALSPLVDQIEARKVPRVLAILLIYIALLVVVGVIAAIIVPLLVGQAIALLNNLPGYASKLTDLTKNLPGQQSDIYNSITREVSSVSDSIVNFTWSILTDLISLVTVIVVTFYLLLDEKNLKQRLHQSLPYNIRDRVISILADVERRLGAWVRGQLVLSAIVGFLYMIGLMVLGVQSPVALAFIGGLCEAIPMIGPIIAAVPAILIAFTQSPFLALAVLALYFIVQQTEGHVIVPNVMRRATGLSPLVVLIAVLVGGRVLGAVGVLISVPVAVVIQVILFDFWGIGLNDTPPATLATAEDGVQTTTSDK